MKHIALHAGVSQATVSLSLANHPRIPVVTRDRIQALARKVGYQPNPFVAALMRSRRRGKPLPERPVLALVCAYDHADGWRRSPSLTLRRSFEGALSQLHIRGFEGQEVWMRPEGMSGDRFSAILHNRGIMGFILGPLAPGLPPPVLRWEWFSVVRIGVPHNGVPVPCVCHDNFNSSYTAVKECLQLGYRRPALIILRRISANLQRRWDAGFLAGIADLPSSRRLYPHLCDSWPDAGALRGFIEHARPDVLITPDHETVGRSLAAAGYSVPGDIGLVSLSSPEEGSPISGIVQNAYAIGTHAADVLVDLVERHQQGVPRVSTSLMIQGQWNPGSTVRRVT